MIKKLRAFIGKTQEGYMKMKKSKVTVFIAAAVATAAFTFFGTDNITKNPDHKRWRIYWQR